MEALTYASDIISNVMEHERANHLHKEAIAQALQIHRKETFAAKAYHQLEVKQANVHHARELLQAQVQHLESVDLEKRNAARENIRDEWQQFTEKAETLIVVNTLMLGVGFAMMIEANLPERTAILFPVLPVVYYSLMALAICHLTMSVHYSVVLRFRIGRIVVKEMRRAIEESKDQDRQFRLTNRFYMASNKAEEVPPATDSQFWPEFAKDVEPLSEIQKEDGQSVPAFVKSPNDYEKETDDIKGAGFHVRLQCSRRRLMRAGSHVAGLIRQRSGLREAGDARTVGGSAGSSCNSEGCPRPIQEQAEVNGYSKKVDDGDALRVDMSGSADSHPTLICRKAPPPVHAVTSTDLSEEPSISLLTWPELGKNEGRGDRIAHEFADIQNQREAEENLLEYRLDYLRSKICDPYALASRLCFIVGTIILLAAACIYVYTQNEPNVEGIDPLPTQPLAGYSFFHINRNHVGDADCF